MIPGVKPRFKPGDKAILTLIENGLGEDCNDGDYNLPMVVTLREYDTHGSYDYKAYDENDKEYVSAVKDKYLVPIFKVGDKVTREHGGDRCIWSNEDGELTVVEVKHGGKEVVAEDSNGNRCYYGHPADQYKLVGEEKMEDVKVGDELEYKRSCHYKKEVLAIVDVEGVKWIVTRDTDDGCVLITEATELETDGWSLNPTTEMTLKQVADRLNIPVDKLRIKD